MDWEYPKTTTPHKSEGDKPTITDDTHENDSQKPTAEEKCNKQQLTMEERRKKIDDE